MSCPAHRAHVEADMERNELLGQAKAALQEAFGKRLKGVILYGSEARGEADPDSDVDLLVLLAGPLQFGQDLRTCIHVLYPLVLDIGRAIDVMPVDVDDYDAQEFPVYREAKTEGIVA
jgi:predicted nucleotidyltransferase